MRADRSPASRLRLPASVPSTTQNRFPGEGRGFLHSLPRCKKPRPRREAKTEDPSESAVRRIRRIPLGCDRTSRAPERRNGKNRDGGGLPARFLPAATRAKEPVAEKTALPKATHLVRFWFPLSTAVSIGGLGHVALPERVPRCQNRAHRYFRRGKEGGGGGSEPAEAGVPIQAHLAFAVRLIRLLKASTGRPGP